MSKGIKQVSPARPANHRRPLAFNPHAEIVRNEHLPIVIGLSHATIWRYRRAGQFPPAIRLGLNSVGFRRRDLDAWLAAREVAVSGR